MVDKDHIRDFHKFLNTASDAQLNIKEQAATELARTLAPGSELRRDLDFLLRLLLEEKLARLESGPKKERRQR